jgi:hypothetical protein
MVRLHVAFCGTQDLDESPALSDIGKGAVDAVLCCNSVYYLARLEEVTAEVRAGDCAVRAVLLCGSSRAVLHALFSSIREGAADG